MKYSSKAEYWEQKYNGQLSRNKELVAKVDYLLGKLNNQREQINKLLNQNSTQKDLIGRLKSAET